VTIPEIQAAIAERRANGCEQIMLVLDRPAGRGRHMRVAPGVLGEIACENADGRAVVWVQIAKLERAIRDGKLR
jgi:hypothetical protein